MKLKYTIGALALTALSATCFQPIQAKKMSDLKIYINPGHGGYTSNDRPIRIHPFEQNDTLGYWESKSNLYKGLHMYHILDSLGATPYLSRIKNTEADDRSLSGISAEANKLGVDLFFSIHSNAGENVNYPIMLYRENKIGTPRYPENVTLSKILWKNLHSSQLTHWTRDKEYVEGDLTFYQNMWEGGLGVLRSLYVVGLLSEGSMHEHRPEAHRLMNDDYCWLEAWHFVKSIMEFYNTEDTFVTGNVAGIVHDDHNLREFVMPAGFSKFGRDLLAPINGAHVELVDASNRVIQTRTTDDMYNGVYVFRNVSPGTYTVRTSANGYYDMSHEVTVTANEVTYQDMPMTYRRESPLTVTGYSPNVGADDAVSCASPIEITFNHDIDVASFEKSFSITPAVEGYFTYSDSYHKVSFKPTVAFEGGITYTVNLSTDLKTTDPYYSAPNLSEPLEFSFMTRSRSRLSKIDQFPANDGQVYYVAPQIEFRFDYRLDANIYDPVTITDESGNKLTISKRTTKSNTLSNNYGNVIYTLPNLEKGKKYTVSVSGELRDRENLPLIDGFTTTFTAIDATDVAYVEPDSTSVFDTFEDAADISPLQDESVGINGMLNSMRSTSVKLFDKASGRITYKFADTHGGQALWAYNGPSAQFYPGDHLGMYINGDFMNHELWVGLAAGTNIKYTKVCDIDFLGWQYREVELNNLEADFAPFTLSQIKIVQKESPITQNGQLAFDNLTVIKATNAIEDITADSGTSSMQAYVSGSTIYVLGAGTSYPVNIYSATGSLITSVKASADGNVTIQAGHLTHGVYIISCGPNTVRLIY